MALVADVKEFAFRALGGVLHPTPLGRRLPAGADGFRVSARPPRLARSSSPKFQILVYHRVLPKPDPFAISSIGAEAFAAQMEILSRCFRVVSLDALVEELDRGGPKPGTVCVTFDDGYRDNHDCAWPILRKHGIPATIYLATGFIGTGESTWYDKVLLAMRDARARRLDFEAAGVRGRDLSSSAQRAALAYSLLEWLKGFAPAERDAHIVALTRALEPAAARDARCMLDWEEVRAMHKGGIAFGGHTVSHPILSRIGAAEMEAEIRGSQSAIEVAVQAPVRHFAYPNGKAGDFGPEAEGILRRHGFASAVTTLPGVNRPESSRYQWLRRQPWDPSVHSFYLRMVLERLAA